MRQREMGGATSDVQTPAERIPRYVVVAAGIVIFGVLLFVVALVLARRATSAPAEFPLAAGATAGSQSTVAPQVSLTPTAVPTPVATQVPTTTPIVDITAPARSPNLVEVATRGIPLATIPPNEGHLTAHPPTSSLELEIRDSYIHFLNVRKQALYDLDPTHLSEVEAGRELAHDTDRIAELGKQGRAIAVDTKHSIYFTKSGPDLAEIYDQYIDQSYEIDEKTKARIGTPTTALSLSYLYELQKLDGTWKVTDAGEVSG